MKVTGVTASNRKRFFEAVREWSGGVASRTPALRQRVFRAAPGSHAA
jgi:hypothetical protein